MLGLMSGTFRPPGDCPVCDAHVPRGAASCPDCGADENTGWDDDGATADGLDLPDDTFDYDEFMEREFGERRPGQWLPKAIYGVPTIWYITAVILLIAFALFATSR